MNLGIITYLADDKSHGYLFSLENLEEKDVFNVIKRSSKDDSFKFELRGHDLGLQRFQIVRYSKAGKSKKTGKPFAKIDSTFFRAIFVPDKDNYGVALLDFDNQIYFINANEDQFEGVKPGIISCQINTDVLRSSVDFCLDNINTQFESRNDFDFWHDKFISLSFNYNVQTSELFDPIFDTIIKFLYSQFKESFDLNKLLTKAILKIKSSCNNKEYNNIIKFITNWNYKYPDFFSYPFFYKIIEPDTALKIELWFNDLYTYQEIFGFENQIPDNILDYAINQNREWQHIFLQKLKSVSISSDQIEKILFNSLSEEFPENFDELKSEIEFIKINFSEHITAYIDELKKNRTAKEQIYLWENGFIELPQISIIKKAFIDLNDDVKTRIINAVESHDKISLLNYAYQTGLLDSQTKNIMFF